MAVHNETKRFGFLSAGLQRCHVRRARVQDDQCGFAARDSAAIAGDPSRNSPWRVMEQALLDAIRATPTTRRARSNLWHTSLVMYDAWCVPGRSGPVPFGRGRQHGRDVQASARRRSYAAYRLLSHRFAKSPGADESLPEFDNLLIGLG